MTTGRADIEAAIAALEAQRASVGDAVIDLALAPLRERLNALDVVANRDEALRIVSVLFLDVVGSTAISRGLDPEDVRALFHPALRRFSDVVERHEGRVLRYAGDGMLALFGAARVREDDAERAVRCGLVLIDQAGTLAPQLEADHGVAGFNVRVGISTGSVLLSPGVGGGFDVSGLCVSVAARMEQTAPPGALRISHDTFAHVRGLFDAVEQTPITIKGLDKPMVTYLVQRAKARGLTPAPRASEGPAAPLVGRDGELSRLIEAFAQVASGSRMKLLMLTGEAGMGKSRLLLAFSDWLEKQQTRNVRFYAQGQSYGAGVPYGLVRDLFFSRFGIADSDTLLEAKRKLSDGLIITLGDRANEQIALIGQLIGLDFSASPHIAGILGDPRQLRDRAFHAATEFLRIAATNATTVALLLDDVHWADAGSLEFIRHLNATCQSASLLCVCGTRPDIFASPAPSQADLSAYERIDIGALPPNYSLHLADALLSRVDDPAEALRKLLIDNAEGNPFYMEEIVRMLVDDQVIIPTQGRWHFVPERLIGFRVPGTLAGVLQARIDALSGSEKSCLQVASVVGAVFWDEAVAQVDGDHARELPHLVERQLIARHEHSAFDSAREFGFHHHLLHRATYDTVLKPAKRDHHARIARWLVSRTTDREGEFASVIAQHFENAGDMANAVVYLIKAAEHANRRFQPTIAIDQLTRAWGLTAEEDLAGRFEVLSRRARALAATGRPSEHEADVATLERLAEQLNEDKCRASAAAARATFAVTAGDFHGAARAAERVVMLAHSVPASTVCLAQINWARAVQYLGDYVQAKTHVEACLTLARQNNERRAERVASVQLGLIDGEQGRFSSARRHLEEALRAARDSGDKTMEGVVINNLGTLEHSIGNYQQARELLEVGRRLSRDVGDALTEAYVHCNLAAVVKELGDASQSQALAMEGVNMARRANASDLEARAHNILGDAQLALGQFDEAVASYEASLALFRQMGRPTMPPLAMSGLARTALKRRDVDAAMHHVAAIVAHLEAGGELDRSCAPGIYFDCFEVMAAASDPRADEFLRLGFDEITKQAQQLEPLERTTFLDNVAIHAAIVKAAAHRLPPEPRAGE